MWLLFKICKKYHSKKVSRPKRPEKLRIFANPLSKNRNLFPLPPLLNPYVRIENLISLIRFTNLECSDFQIKVYIEFRSSALSLFDMEVNCMFLY